jgi:hypothetical protein
MKPTIASVLFLACAGALLGSTASGAPATGRGSLLDDLVRMTRTGSSDAELLVYAKAHRRELPPEVSDDILRWLHDSGVSERVVSYMSAIDVRASDEASQTGGATTYDQPRRPSYSYPEGDESRYPDQSDGGYPESYAYSDNYAGPGYPENSCDSCWGYGYSPYWDYGYPYGFFVYQVPIDRFHGHDHRFHGGHGHDGHHHGHGEPRGVMNAGRGSRDAWRERGSGANARTLATLRPRGQARPVPPRQSAGPGLRTASRPVGPRGFAASPRARGSLPMISRAPRASAGSRGFGGGPGFFGGSARGPVVSPGGRGRR